MIAWSICYLMQVLLLINKNLPMLLQTLEYDVASCFLLICYWSKFYVVHLLVHTMENNCSLQYYRIKPILKYNFATPLWGKYEDEIRTHKSGNLESFGTSETSYLDWRGENTSLWCVFYTVGKVLKCRCRKRPRMSHSDIYSTSYGRKKGWESNWQFDSRPLKVGNRPDPGVCR
jgi:hypothetical protein